MSGQYFPPGPHVLDALWLTVGSASFSDTTTDGCSGTALLNGQPYPQGGNPYRVGDEQGFLFTGVPCLEPPAERAELDALAAVVVVETDPTRSKPIVEFLKAYGVNSEAPEPPRDVTEVDSKGTVSIEPALIAVLDSTKAESLGTSNEETVRFVNSGIGALFSTGEDGTHAWGSAGRSGQ